MFPSFLRAATAAAAIVIGCAAACDNRLTADQRREQADTLLVRVTAAVRTGVFSASDVHDLHQRISDHFADTLTSSQKGPNPEPHSLHGYE